MRSPSFRVSAIVAAVLLAAPTFASVIITQQSAAAPTYSTTLNFDEPGGPTGSVPQTQWLASKGITLYDGANPGGYVFDAASIYGAWLGSGNVFYGAWGNFMTFQNKLTSFSAQDFDTSGPAGPMGGGMLVDVLDGGVEVASLLVNPSFSPTGKSWYNITTDGGSVFDEVRFVGWGFPADNYIDNLSWNAVPEPTSLVLLALGGLTLARRRA